MLIKNRFTKEVTQTICLRTKPEKEVVREQSQVAGIGIKGKSLLVPKRCDDIVSVHTLDIEADGTQSAKKDVNPTFAEVSDCQEPTAA